jgi:hypothetical protein
VVGRKAAQPAPHPALAQLIRRAQLFVRPASPEEPGAAGGGEREGKREGLVSNPEDPLVLPIWRGGLHVFHGYSVLANVKGGTEAGDRG